MTIFTWDLEQGGKNVYVIMGASFLVYTQIGWSIIKIKIKICLVWI